MSRLIEAGYKLSSGTPGYRSRAGFENTGSKLK